MATTVERFDLCPPEEELCFARGDTFLWERVLVDEAGDAIDITGRTYLLTVDSRRNPDDASTLLFQVSGVVPTGTDGKVQFQFSDANWTSFTDGVGQPPATAFYDLQETESGARRTLRKGKFVVQQDVTK